MIEFKLSELAEIAGACLQGADLGIKKVSTDSRDCKGALFIALKGERFDAHDFIGKAVENGAAAVGVSRDISLPAGVSVIKCADTLRLLGLAGLLVRQKCPAKVVSLTGSCGKTTVKELTAAILSEVGKTQCTKGNFNNDVGVPLTLLSLEKDTQYAVIEQGASHLKDIGRTCEFVRSQAALINNVGGAHIEGFGSYEGVYKGKSEILDDVLSRGGIGILPRDSQWFESWQRDYEKAFTEGKIMTFGSHPDSDVRFSGVSESADGVSFTISYKDKSFAASLNMLGAHNASNAAAACALSLAAGAPFDALKTGLSKAKTLKGRLTVTDYKNFTLIDDAYNASFNAVIAALDTLKLQQGRRVMIFGDMGELGSAAEELHRGVGEHARDCVDEILCEGQLTKFTAQAAGARGMHFESRAALISHLEELINKERCCFLIKGSHAMRMDEIGQALTAKYGDLK